MLDHLWAVFTVGAAALQTARNAMQKEMTARLGTLGATHVRFLYGAPFAALFFVVVVAAVGRLPPAPDLVFGAWVVFGGFAQILATMLMLAAMRERSFVVTVAYTKTEPVQAALIAIVVLGESVTPLMAAAILIANAGVMVMSWPNEGTFSWRPALCLRRPPSASRARSWSCGTSANPPSCWRQRRRWSRASSSRRSHSRCGLAGASVPC
jgi:drug/metabolite transporter (DMT)-like permease